MFRVSREKLEILSKNDKNFQDDQMKLRLVDEDTFWRWTPAPSTVNMENSGTFRDDGAETQLHSSHSYCLLMPLILKKTPEYHSGFWRSPSSSILRCVFKNKGTIQICHNLKTLCSLLWEWFIIVILLITVNPNRIEI